MLLRGGGGRGLHHSPQKRGTQRGGPLRPRFPEHSSLAPEAQPSGLPSTARAAAGPSLFVPCKAGSPGHSAPPGICPQPSSPPESPRSPGLAEGPRGSRSGRDGSRGVAGASAAWLPTRTNRCNWQPWGWQGLLGWRRHSWRSRSWGKGVCVCCCCCDWGAEPHWAMSLGKGKGWAHADFRRGRSSSVHKAAPLHLIGTSQSLPLQKGPPPGSEGTVKGLIHGTLPRVRGWAPEPDCSNHPPQMSPVLQPIVTIERPIVTASSREGELLGPQAWTPCRSGLAAAPICPHPPFCPRPTSCPVAPGVQMSSPPSAAQESCRARVRACVRANIDCAAVTVEMFAWGGTVGLGAHEVPWRGCSHPSLPQSPVSPCKENQVHETEAPLPQAPSRSLGGPDGLDPLAQLSQHWARATQRPAPAPRSPLLSCPRARPRELAAGAGPGGAPLPQDRLATALPPPQSLTWPR